MDALREMVEEWLDQPRHEVGDESEDEDQPWLWESAEEMVREENDLIYRALEQHLGGDIGLFVSIWNSKREPAQAESPERAVNVVSPGDGKVEVWSYVQGGMRDCATGRFGCDRARNGVA